MGGHGLMQPPPRGRDKRSGGKGADGGDDASEQDPWELAWNATLESSASARARGINAVCEKFLEGYEADTILEMSDRIADTVHSALTGKKSDKQIETAAARLFSVAAVTLGRDCGSLFDAVADPLQDRCRKGRAQGACTAAYATGAFCAALGDTERLDALRFVAGQWLNTKGNDLVDALRGWSLLLTAVDVRTLSAPLIEAFLQHLSAYLSGAHVAVRGAAGEALGVLYSVCGLEVLPEDDDELLSSDDASASAASIDGSACAVNSESREALETGFQGVVARLEELAINRGDASRRSKADRKASRKSAVAVLGEINGSAARPEAFRFKSGGKVTFESLPARVQREALVSVLGSAFQKHMERNPLMEEVFSLDDGLQSGPTKAEKKQWYEDADKANKDSNKVRHNKTSAKMAAHMMDDFC